MKATRKSALGGLILTMRWGEQIWLANGEIKIEIIESGGRQVRVALKGNRDIRIDRKSLQTDRQMSDDQTKGE